MPPSKQLTSSALEALRAGKVAGAWTLDASKSEVRLATKSMWGLVPVKGVFRQVSGNAAVSASGDVTGTVTVAAGSLDTKNARRDAHLRSADFFDTASHPDITFTVSGITPSAGGVTVTGRLTVRGRTAPVSFDAVVSSFDGDEAWLDGELRLNRADFGMTWNQMGMAAMASTIIVHAVFTRQ